MFADVDLFPRIAQGHVNRSDSIISSQPRRKRVPIRGSRGRDWSRSKTCRAGAKLCLGRAVIAPSGIPSVPAVLRQSVCDNPYDGGSVISAERGRTPVKIGPRM